MTRKAILSIGLLLSLRLVAQDRSPSDQSTFTNCGFDETHRDQLLDPIYRREVNRVDSLLAYALLEERGGGIPITIPVVVHVIHKGEPIGTGSNPSDATIQGVIDCVNERYAGTLGNGVNTGISFCLAQLDTLGQPTNGIDRVNGSIFPNYVTDGMSVYTSPDCDGPSQFDISQSLRWPTTSYYNVYLVWTMCNTWYSGFAFYPGSDHQYYDGSYIRTGAFGCTLTAHEFGHGMGLYHTFEGDNGGAQCPVNNDCTLDGDRVCDTPPHKTNDCVPSSNPCDTAMSIWANSYTNYMSYCGALDRFTQQQKVRMQNSITTLRSSLMNSFVCTPDTCLPTASAFDREQQATSLGAGSFTLSWNDQFADQVNVRYKAVMDWMWTTYNGSTTGEIDVVGVPICTQYEFQIEVICDGSGTGWGPSFYWIRNECVGCQDNKIYCASGASITTAWIENVTIGAYSNASGNNDGYALFAAPTTTLYRGMSYPLSVTPSAGASAYIKAWMDWDADGLFEDSEELVLDPIGVVPTTALGAIDVPVDALIRDIRLRVALSGNTEILGPCEVGFFKETEDYCIAIVDLSMSDGPAPSNTNNVLMARIDAISDNILVLNKSITGSIYDMLGRVHRNVQESMFVPLNGLTSGTYILKTTTGETVRFIR